MRRIPFVLSLVAVALIGLAALGRPGPGAGAQDGTPAADGDRLVGSWILTVQATDGRDQWSFVNVATFGPGGVLVNTSPDSPLGHGAWERAGDGAYAITFVIPDFDDEGDLEGLATVRATITLGSDGDTFSGPFATEVADLAGNVLFSFGGTAEGRRIAVEPLPPGTPTAATPAP